MRRPPRRSLRGVRERSVLVLVGLLLAVATRVQAKQDAAGCAAAKAAATARLSVERVACVRAALRRGVPESSRCIDRAVTKFGAKIGRIERKGACRTQGDTEPLSLLVNEFIAGVGNQLRTPTEGGILVEWTLQRDGAPTQCEALPSTATVRVTRTPAGGGAPAEALADCGSNRRPFKGGFLPANVLIGDVPFGTWTVDLALLDASSQVIGSAPPATVTLASDSCFLISSGGDCVQRLVFEIAVD